MLYVVYCYARYDDYPGVGSCGEHAVFFGAYGDVRCSIDSGLFEVVVFCVWSYLCPEACGLEFFFAMLFAGIFGEVRGVERCE